MTPTKNKIYIPPTTHTFSRSCVPENSIKPPIIHAVGKENKISMTHEQSWILKCACAGLDIMIEGSGGTGKTHIIRQYLKIRLEKNTNIELTQISPNHDKNTENRIFRPWDKIPDPAKNKISILIVDEFSSLTAEIIESSHLYGQIIIAGDSAQEKTNIHVRISSKLIYCRNGLRTTLTQQWRTGNQTRADLINALFHHGLYDPLPTLSQTKQVPATVSILTDDKSLLNHMINRLAYHTTQNPHSSILFASANREILEHALAYQRTLAPQAAQKISIKHSHAIQGREADILIANPHEDEKTFCLHAIGRAKHLSEITLLPHQKFSSKFFRMSVKRANPEEGLNWRLKKDKKDQIEIMAGPSPRSTLSRLAFAASRRWKASIEPNIPDK